MFVLLMMFLGMYFLMFLEILRTFERFFTNLTNVGFQGGVNSQMTCDVISFCTSCTTVLPFASETKIVCALSTDMVVAEMVVEYFWVRKGMCTVYPEAFVKRRRRRAVGQRSSHWEKITSHPTASLRPRTIFSCFLRS